MNVELFKDLLKSSTGVRPYMQFLGVRLVLPNPSCVLE